MDEPRTILTYGDSNTWGSIPSGGGRYPRSVRWPGVLAATLGSGWHVVEAGLRGRTTIFDDPMGDRNGARHQESVLASAAPVDVVVLLLGTNDLKTRFAASAFEIADGAGRLIDLMRAGASGPGGAAPKVLLVAPPPILPPERLATSDPHERADYAAAWRDGHERSRDFARQYTRVARLRGTAFLDAGLTVSCSPRDGIHWEAESHTAFGRAVAAAVTAL